MKVTKQHKLLFGILGLGLTLLTADRVSSRTPPANEPNHDSGVAVERSATISTPAAPSAPLGPSLAIRLERLTEQNPSGPAARDIFATAAGFTPEASSTSEFQQKYKLSTILKNGNRSVAIVDGNKVGLGETLDGYRLVSLGNRSAVFASATDRVELTLDR